MKHFNQLTAAEDELLAFLAEECAEVIQAVTKIQRHGFNSSNPLATNPVTNRRSLECEIGHVLAAVNMLDSEGHISGVHVTVELKQKLVDVRRWLHHQAAPK